MLTEGIAYSASYRMRSDDIPGFLGGPGQALMSEHDGSTTPNGCWRSLKLPERNADETDLIPFRSIFDMSHRPTRYWDVQPTYVAATTATRFSVG